MKKELWSKEDLLKLIFPLIIEQILAVSVGMADMIMVSGAGEIAVSGVSLVNTISNLLIYVFSAMATGGAIVASQAIGAKNEKIAQVVANQLILVCFVISIVITVLSLIFNQQVLYLIYGSVEQGVMNNAIVYFYITALSFPFLAVYYGAAALLRSMGNSQLSMYVSTVMNILNIVGNAILIYCFSLGIAGVGIATLVSRMVACFIVIIVLRNPKYPLHIDRGLHLGFHPHVIQMILKFGVPSGIDNAMFQIGKLFTQSLISTFSTAAIAANATASTIELLATIPASAMSLAITTVVGQCVGANHYDLALQYAKKMLKWAYMMLWAVNIVIMFMSRTIVSWYHLTVQGESLAIQLIVYHSMCCMAIWPLAFTVPHILRAAGDVQFVMMSSMMSMWVFRIALSYVIGQYLGLGVLGVWIAMTIDWLVRSLLYLWRLKSGRWKKESVIT